jgi:hypothetical protein
MSSIDDLAAREKELLEDLEEYNREKEHIRTMLGKIGGKDYSKRDNLINITFLALILILFLLEITTHFLPSFVSIEVSVLLVSIKIVWMIHSQQKFNHFQFWILNTLEFRVNDMTRKVRKIEKVITSTEKLG